MKWALVLACVVLAAVAGLFVFSQRELSRIESRYPPVGQRLRLHGLELHYVEGGRGPAVVLLHGASTNLRDFTASIFDPLARHCRVVAFDRPGHGYSTYPGRFWMSPREQAAVIQDALGNLGIEQAVWLGHSWAGAVVMAALLDFPRKVTGGVLLSGAAYHWRGGVDWSSGLADMPIAGTLLAHSLLIPAGRLLMDDQITAAFSPNQPTPGYRRRTGIDLVLRPSQFTVNGRDLRLLSDFLSKQSKRYHTIEQPLLLIHGEKDDIVPAWNHAHRLARLLPQSVLSELPDTGHVPHHVHPEEIARRVARFACS